MENVMVSVSKNDLETLFAFVDSINEAINDTEMAMDEEEQTAYDNLLNAVYQPEEV